SLCKLCSRPYDCLSWRSKGGRKFQTYVCRKCAEQRYMCQSCLNDMQYMMPVLVRQDMQQGGQVYESERSREHKALLSEQADSKGELFNRGNAVSRVVDMAMGVQANEFDRKHGKGAYRKGAHFQTGEGAVVTHDRVEITTRPGHYTAPVNEKKSDTIYVGGIARGMTE
ncbi:hypothetical protein KIPB_014199, partial [Kipferlia bialata]